MAREYCRHASCLKGLVSFMVVLVTHLFFYDATAHQELRAHVFIDIDVSIIRSNPVDERL